MRTYRINYRLVARCAKISTALLLCSVLGVSQYVSAQSAATGLSNAQLQLYNNGVRRFDINACDPTGGGIDTTSSAANGSKTSYVLGDSISTGLAGVKLDDQLKAKLGGDSYINHDSGRSITGAGTEVHTSALAAADQDKAKITAAGSIIIVLGTNQTDAPFEQNLKALMTKLKASAPDAKYYWVDIGATANSQVAGWDARNKIIYGDASSQGYTVISRYQALFGKDKDPKNIDSSLHVPNSPDNIHGGYPQLATAILDAVTKSSATATAAGTVSAQCCNTSGDSTSATNATTAPDPNKNIKTIFEGLVGKGLKPYMAAAILGNMKGESGYDPTITEGGGHADEPSHGVGFGLIQWTFAERQDPLVAKAHAAGKKSSDLGIQIDYIWDELNSKFKASVLDPLNSSTDLTAAEKVVEENYEVHANRFVLQPLRLETAKSVLAQAQKEGWKGSADIGTSSGGSGSCGAAATGSNINTNLPTNESSDQLIQEIIATGNIKYGVENLTHGTSCTPSKTLLAVILRLAQKYSFYITQGCHAAGSGNAFDLQNINVKGVPLGPVFPADYDKIDQDADNFATDLATLEPKSNGALWIGVPNQHYKDMINTILRAKDPTNASYQANLDQPSLTGATGAHFHTAVPSDAP